MEALYWCVTREKLTPTILSDPHSGAVLFAVDQHPVVSLYRV